MAVDRDSPHPRSAPVSRQAGASPTGTGNGINSGTSNYSEAENGKQALEVIHHDMPDLVITDVMMPVMDGNELCRRIKENDKTHHLPVMMLTARLADENEIESRECGADDYIKKPFSMDLFKLHIDQLLKQGRIVDNGKVDPKISKTAITTQDEAFIDKATRYIEEHLSDSDLTVEQMSDDLAMSRVQLYRRVVSITGKTPSELIRLVRLRHAERLLVQSQLSISEIGYMVGFSSTRYFSRCFKDLYGAIEVQKECGVSPFTNIHCLGV